MRLASLPPSCHPADSGETSDGAGAHRPGDQRRMRYFLDQLINGLTLGSIYGLIAIGYTMVYGIIGMINFAHGDIFMVGAFISMMVIVLVGLTGDTGLVMMLLSLLLVLVIAMAFTSIWGWTVERIAYRPLRGSFRLAPLITAIGMSIVLQN